MGPNATINQVWSYNPATDAWTQVADLPMPLRAFGAAVRLGGTIYVFGGFDGVAPTNAVHLYDIMGDAWSRGPDMPGPRFGSAVGIVNGKIVVAGGASDVIESTTWIYDPVTQSFDIGSPMPTGVNTFRIHGAGFDDPAVLHAFAGGFDGNLHLIYDLTADTWTMGPPMPFGVTDPAVVSVGTNIYVMGGLFPGRTQIFDTVGGTWLPPGPTMPGGINNTSGAVAGGVIYVEGGFDGVTSNPANFALGFGVGVLQGQVTDATTGAPIAGASVRAVAAVTRSGTTDTAGNYSIQGLNAGTYDVTADASGYGSQTAMGVAVDEITPTTQDFALMPL